MRGAELAPSSLTLGIESGRGVVSISCCWENLVPVSQSNWCQIQINCPSTKGKSRSGGQMPSMDYHTVQLTYWGFRVDIFAMSGGEERS